tara:strand:- start:60 stop:359 length:300 start_codon:yes stop_codon:yes gene_type:complete
MSKKKKQVENSLLSREQELQLEKIVSKMINLAAETAEEYKEMDLSELQALSGSITQIHEDAPFLNETFKGDAWKKVLAHVPTKPKFVEEDENDLEENAD